jgi:1-pyrroline-5-carboxylate dehydrogenase
LWNSGVRDELVAVTESLSYGDVADFSNFGGAVIDRRAFNRLSAAIERAEAAPDASVLVGGKTDDSEGFFVRPTVVEARDPASEFFRQEYFGPLLAVHVYADDAWDSTVTQLESVAPYALTGAVFARDRAAVVDASARLRFAAGNFYINDKPTGAVVGQQPFGGARASGTNDKAGSVWNLVRWLSPRAVKENFVPPTDHRYPHMAQDGS